MLQRNAHYVGHALKNDLSKIEWCTQLLDQQGIQGRELENHFPFGCTSEAVHQPYTAVFAADHPDPQALQHRGVFEDVIAAAVFPENSGIGVKIHACDEEPLVCDQAHLEEVLRNLISNAADAMPEGGEIPVLPAVQPARGKAVISVSDKGHGISPEQLQLLFEPYFTTKKDHQNMGLGLYYCWNVMAAAQWQHPCGKQARLWKYIFSLLSGAP